MKQRWYDKEPTLSMAVSLLQNSPQESQELTARYAMQYLQRHSLVPPGFLQTQEGPVKFIFPIRRRKFDLAAHRLLETMKRLPEDVQQIMAVLIINYIYLLDSGRDIEELETPDINSPQTLQHPQVSDGA